MNGLTSDYIPFNDETFDDYCHRISMMRSSESLTWNDVRDIINQNTNEDFSESYYRKKEASRFSVEDSLSDEFSELLELKKQKMKMSDERVQTNALIRRISREETLKEIAKDTARTINYSSRFNAPPEVSITHGEKEAILMLSDWHYGMDINNHYNVFNPTVAEERCQRLLDKVDEKCKLNGVKKIHVLNLGDMIAGNIHLTIRLNSRIDVVSQTMQVAELLAKFIYELSNRGYYITYTSVYDNHSRVDPVKSDSIDLESFVRLIDWYLRVRIPFIEYTQKEDSIDDVAKVPVLNYNVAAVHGDKDNQRDIIKSLNNFMGQHFDLICSAHYHHFSSDEQNYTEFVSNGALMGTDDYSEKLRCSSKASQTLIIATEENIIDDICKINLN